MANEQEIKTAFIPKRPLVESDAPKSKSIGLVSFLATVIFILAIAGAGASYFYKSSLIKKKDVLQSSMARAQNTFDDPKLLLNIQNLDKRLSATKAVLSGHATVYPIFKSLEDSTLKTVRFTRFGYDISGDGDNASVIIKLSGIASSYNSIALQSDIFGKKNFLHNVVFSNLNLDDKGRVAFDLTFSVDSSVISFEKYLNAQNKTSDIPIDQPVSPINSLPDFNLNVPAQ